MNQPLPSASSQYLSFFIAGEEYALGILQVKEIIEYDTVTRLPGASNWVRGVFNLRGSVVPVVDLAVRMGLPPATISRWSCIVVVEVQSGAERVVVGLLADNIGQVIELAPQDVEQTPSFGTSVNGHYLVGMGRSGRKFVMLLDIDRMLASQELLQATRLQAPAGAQVESRPVKASTGGSPGVAP